MLVDGSSAGGPHPGPQQLGAKRVPWVAVLSIGAYALLALAAYWPTWPGDPHRAITCPCGDPSEAVWFLAWTPHAILHGANPFFTTAINHPHGINLAVNTGMPLLGLLVAPLTLAVGPVASLNLLMWLAYPLSASAMLFVLRRWTTWWPAAILGGLLYGFSPYMTGQGRLHLQLVFVPLPPLIALAIYEIVVGRSSHRLRWGAALGLALTAQFLVSTEIAASTCLVALIALVVLAAAHPRRVVPTVRAALPAAGVAVAVTSVCLAYPVWMALLGPQRYGEPVAVLNAFAGRSGLLGVAAPTASMRVAPSWVAALARTTPGFGDTVENGAYLGAPLLLAAGYFVIRFRQNRWLTFLAVMALAIYVLTLGPHLDLGARRTSIPLPFDVIERLPTIDLLDPIRLSLFVTMFVTIIVALGLDEARARWTGQQSHPSVDGDGQDGRRPSTVEVAGVVVLLVVSVVLWVPRWPVATAATSVPPYFTSPTADRVPPGSTTLLYPYPVPGSAAGMLWQATTGMRFDLLGSYALGPGPHGDASQFPSVLRPGDVQRLFYGEEGVNPEIGPPFPVTPDDPSLVADVARFLRANRVGTVLVAPLAPNSRAVTALVTSALGRPPDRSGGIDAWYDVPRLVDTTVAGH